MKEATRAEYTQTIKTRGHYMEDTYPMAKVVTVYWYNRRDECVAMMRRDAVAKTTTYFTAD